MDCGLAVRYDVLWPSVIISPGGGSVGSFSWRFINTVERLRPVWDVCLFLVTELLFDEPRPKVSKMIRIW